MRKLCVISNYVTVLHCFQNMMWCCATCILSFYSIANSIQATSKQFTERHLKHQPANTSSNSWKFGQQYFLKHLQYPISPMLQHFRDIGDISPVRFLCGIYHSKISEVWVNTSELNRNIISIHRNT